MRSASGPEPDHCSSRLITPGRVPLRLPFALERLITRPAPWTVERSVRAASSDSTPSTTTAQSPIEPPTNPVCPGNAGVAPLRTT